MKKTYTIFIISFLLLIVLSNQSYSQKVAKHDLGKICISLRDDGNMISEGWSTTAQILYPNGMYRRDCMKFWTDVFFAKNWTNELGEVQDETYWTPEQTYEGNGIGLYIYTYNRFTRPTIIVDGNNITQPFIGKIDEDIPSDVYVDWKFRTKDAIGMDIHHETWTYVNENHDDYIIVKQNLKFTGDINEEDGQDVVDQTIDFAWFDALSFDFCRVAIQDLDRSTWYNGHSWATWDSYVNYTGKPLLVTGRPRNDLLISYEYQTDDIQDTAPEGYTNSEVLKYYENTGTPDAKTGMFLSPQYGGMAMFHVDKSASDGNDDPDMPKSIAYLEHSNNFWGKVWPWTSNWNYVIDPNNRPVEIYKEYGIGYNETTGLENLLMTQGLGPYQLSIGDDINAIYAIGFGMIDEDLCYSEGQKWYNWYWDKSGEQINDTQKNSLIATGKDSLFQNLDRAYWAYSRNMDVPDPLPAPDIEVTSGPDQIEIKWGYSGNRNSKDPDTGMDDFDHWRVYRKMGALEVDAETDLGVYRKYELIGTFDKGTTTYIDTDVSRGVQYHYCVTAVDDGSQNSNGIFPGQSLESSYYANRTTMGATSIKPGLNSADEVLIVPNPYSLSTGMSNLMNWPGSPNEVRFMNLPAYCTLKIYTSTGDLIKTIEHTNGSGDEAWSHMRTDNNQYPVSGVYILVVDNAKDLYNNNLPKKMFKFVIVR